MRDLTLSDCLVEGFIRNVTVEGKVRALENLMNYSLSATDGFVKVPVYQLWANNKSYGQDGYWIIKDVKVKEVMRDLQGYATRASVDISLTQVPKYQVNTGVDQASQVASAAKSILANNRALTPTQAATAQANQVKGKTAGPSAPSTQGPAAGNPRDARSIQPNP
jgi:hypothetical protein